MLSRWWVTVLAVGASAASVVLAQPMPPRRPPTERVESPKHPPARTPEAQSEKTPQPEALHAQQPTDGVECLAKLRAAGWDAEPATPAANRSECSVPEPVAVKRLRVRDKVVEFPDGPVLNCRFADRLGQWTSDLVTRRSRNRVEGGPDRTRVRVPQPQSRRVWQAQRPCDGLAAMWRVLISAGGINASHRVIVAHRPRDHG